MPPANVAAAAPAKRVRRFAGAASFARRRPWDLAFIPAVIWLTVFYFVPVIGAVIQSFTNFVPPESGGLDNYAWFFGSSVNVQILIRTLLTALIVTAVCLLLGFPYAYLMTICSSRTRGIMLAAVMLPLWTSLLIRSFSWIAILQPSGPLNTVLEAVGLGEIRILGTTTAVVLGMSQILIPFMILPLYAVLQTIDRNLLVAAGSLGARPFAAFTRVYLPLSAPGLFAGALLVYVLALGFFVTPALLGSPANALLSQLIVTQTGTLLAFGRAGAAAAVLLVVTVLLVVVAGRIALRYSRGTKAERGGS